MRPHVLLSAFVATPSSSFIEWVAYHRAIGANQIVIFVDQEHAEPPPLLHALARAGVLSIVPAKVGVDLSADGHGFSLSVPKSSNSDETGYRLHLQPDEYFCLHGEARNLQELLRSTSFPEVLYVPTRLAEMAPHNNHMIGAILRDQRSVAPIDTDNATPRLARLGLKLALPTKKWGSLRAKETAELDWCAASGAKASVISIPAPTDEQVSIEDQIDQPETLGPTDSELSALDALSSAASAEHDALMALPSVNAAYEALCSKERRAGNRLRVSSRASQRMVLATEERAVSGTQTPDMAVMPRWFAEVNLGGENEGFYTRLKHHAVVCIRRNPRKLAVTFDNLSSVNDTSPDREPWAYKFVRDNGYSHLSVMARRKDWYRDPQLISYLENLAADGFFTSFDRVIFSGTSMGGFAALAFASLSPGATVVSFNPQTTLEEALVPWETRFSIGRKRDWSLPHSDCAFEIDEVGKAFVLFDPFFALDRRHAERLEGDKVIFLKTWCSGHFSPVFLRRAGLLKPIMQHAFDDTLEPEVFYRMFRARRMLPWYRKSLIENLQQRGHDELAKRVTPAFRKLKQEKAL